MDWNKEDERRERDAESGKRVMALSRAQYRGFAVIETTQGFGVFLGTWFFMLSTLQMATDLIDQWLQAKRN